jgi:hypothetical protein
MKSINYYQTKEFLKNNLSYKQVSFIISLKNLISWIIKLKRFFSIYKLGENDNYPEIPYPNCEKSFFKKLFFRNPDQRYHFWNKVALNYKSFKSFYINSDTLRRENAPIPKDFKYSKELYEFYEKGISEINDFLDEKTYRLIVGLFEQNIDPSILKNQSNSLSHEYLIREKKINELLHSKIIDIEKILFGKQLKCQKYRLQALQTIQNESVFRESVHFHLDRFIPAFKLLYFPFKVDIDPFEYYEGSHVINEQFKKNALVFMRDGHIKEQDQRFNHKNYNKRTCFLDRENTLIIAATHGLHRRMPSNKEGVRKFITISWYYVFTRYDLLLSYLKK